MGFVPKIDPNDINEATVDKHWYFSIQEKLI